jgi:hypothetical protein
MSLLGGIPQALPGLLPRGGILLFFIFVAGMGLDILLIRTRKITKNKKLGIVTTICLIGLSIIRCIEHSLRYGITTRHTVWATSARTNAYRYLSNVIFDFMYHDVVYTKC